MDEAAQIVLMLFSEEDEEVFEDNPEEYIRRDIEGSGKNIVYFPVVN